MKEPLLAFLIPSRRFDGLLRAVRSLRLHPDEAAFEIRAWLDSDDRGSLQRITELEPFKVHVHVGPRLSGYHSTGDFCTEMANASRAQWICLMDDDNYFEGASFIEDLRRQPREGVYCTPKRYQLNLSAYFDFYQYGIVPNGAWKCRAPIIGHPTDKWMHDALVVQRGWRVHRLENTTMHHNRVECSYPLP